MKKIIITAMALLMSLSLAKAGGDKPISPDRLPAAAREFIARHFSDVKISYAKVDYELFDTTYEVVFVDGRKVEFDDNGVWREVDCKFGRVPEGILPHSISEYLKKHYPDRYAVEIDKERKYYEIKLDNGIELKFNYKYKLIGIDD